MLNDFETKICCLCGSTRFKESFYEWNKKLTLLGIIVLMPGVFGHSGDTVTIRQKEDLDKLHKRKIALSNFIIVINKDNYIGESTKSEIEFAHMIGIPVYYMTDLLKEKKDFEEKD